MDLTPEHLGLGRLIERLRREPDQSRRIKIGFGNPHSYRGYYEDVAFEIVRDVTVGDMLTAAVSALGSTFQGWKGGDFTMGEYTSAWLVTEEGDCGESIGAVLLQLMLDDRAGREVDLGQSHTRDDVQLGIQALLDNRYDRELDVEDLEEVVELVLTYATKRIREAERLAGREDAARDGVTVNADDLGIVLDQRVQHSHMRPGIWDDSNRPEIAGKPCVECAARGRLRAALNVADQVNQPRTPSGCDGEDSPEERQR